MKKALIALLVCMLASPAFAETRYQIEVLIFSQPPLSDSETRTNALSTPLQPSRARLLGH